MVDITVSKLDGKYNPCWAFHEEGRFSLPIMIIDDDRLAMIIGMMNRDGANIIKIAPGLESWIKEYREYCNIERKAVNTQENDKSSIVKCPKCDGDIIGCKCGMEMADRILREILAIDHEPQDDVNDRVGDNKEN